MELLDRRQITALASALAAENLLAFRNLRGNGPLNLSWNKERIVMCEACGRELILHVLAVVPHGRRDRAENLVREAAMRHHGYYDYAIREAEGFTLARISVYGLQTDDDFTKELTVMSSRLDALLGDLRPDKERSGPPAPRKS